MKGSGERVGLHQSKDLCISGGFLGTELSVQLSMGLKLGKAGSGPRFSRWKLHVGPLALGLMSSQMLRQIGLQHFMVSEPDCHNSQVPGKTYFVLY